MNEKLACLKVTFVNRNPQTLKRLRVEFRRPHADG